MVLRQTMRFRGCGLGGHTIRRAGTSREAARLRHVHRVLPRGVHRTRMSEVRGPGVRPAVLPQPHPVLPSERIPAVRLPVNWG